MREEAVLFGKIRSLVGIVTDPPQADRVNNLPAILLLNSGIVHRAGVNRLHVKMARNLSAMGFVVLRFDFSGIGDSKVRNDTLPFIKSAVEETQEAMNFLHTARGIERFILTGICSGANISYKTACCDQRVAGAILINAQGHLHGTDDELDSYYRDLSLKHHYWRILLSSSFSAKNWWKAITGKVDYRSIISLMMGFPLRSLFTHKRKVYSEANDIPKDVRLLNERGVRLLHIHSEGDEGLDYLHVILGDKMEEWSAGGQLRVEIIQGANHTFILLENQKHLLEIIRNCVQEMMNTEFHGL